jgi:branched-chain amino acid transport system permease protein
MTRETAASGRRPLETAQGASATRGLGLALLVVAVFLLPLASRGRDYYLIVLTLCAINVTLASSFRLIATVGQISIGTMAFAGIGGYTSAILMMKLNLPFWAAFPLAGLASTAVAAAVAFPFVRVMGIYFAMLTLFFGEIVRLIMSEWGSMTGGSTGLLNIPSIGILSFAGMSIDFGHLLPYSYFVLVIMFLILLIFYRIDRSHLGTTLPAIERDEAVSASVGINVIKYKVTTFCLGSFFIGLAGSLYAHHLRVLNPDTFGLFPSIYIVIYAVAGGRKSFAGPIIGAVVLTIVPEASRVLKQYQPLISVGVLFFVLFFMRGGLVSLPGKITARMRAPREGRAANA